MYILKTKSEFDSAHFLKDYEGKCANIHGHRWVVTIEVGAETLEESGSDRGMVVDFGKLKDDLKQETDRLDHVFIIEKGSLRETTMTAMKEEVSSFMAVFLSSFDYKNLLAVILDFA